MLKEKLEWRIFRLLNSFINVCPDITWDRFTYAGTEYTFYGWIKRGDKKRDFIVLNFTDPKEVWYCTSSAKYSETFSRLLKTPHIKCQTMTHLFEKAKSQNNL